ncbi:MAG: ATP-binding cassette domain-containing protein, partial [Lachnospiraceae bacterium]|nr:ATP-binding cassette domain-containing protein [Lachnospiraceae bacterium]
VVGPTGCGKSTIIRLLLGFEKPSKGSIYYDKKDLKTLVLKSVRKKIGTVMQNDGLFSGDVFSNISINNPHMTMDEAWEVAREAMIYDDIKAMPMQMKTMISEGNGGIAGGQQVRLLLARALASKPKTVIFDAATSALDNVTQKKISESLEKLECTRIAVAHRLSTIRHCDRIIVIDSGHIVEEGTYEELIKNDGLFKKLVERQRVDI